VLNQHHFLRLDFTSFLQEPKSARLGGVSRSTAIDRHVKSLGCSPPRSLPRRAAGTAGALVERGMPNKPKSANSLTYICIKLSTPPQAKTCIPGARGSFGCFFFAIFFYPQYLLTLSKRRKRNFQHQYTCLATLIRLF